MLILILNGGDLIWSFGRSYLQSEISASVLWSFSPGQFSSSVRSCFIRGLIELIFGEHVLNSLILILTGEDWNLSSEQWCLCPRTVTLFCEISLFVLCKLICICQD